MNTYARALILSAMTAVSLTQGCSCSDDDDPMPVVIDPPPIEEEEVVTVAVSGTAAKGIIQSGIVNACPLVSGDVDCSTPIASGVTNEAGLYSIDIPDTSFGVPFVVRVSANADTRMMCDVASGCGTADAGIDFGELYTPSDTFKLDAFLPEVVADTTPTVNLTTLTDLSSSFAFNSITEDTSAADIATIIETSNSRIADLFDIDDDDITSLPVIDLTDPVAVAAADISDLNYNLLGPAIVGASRLDDATRTIEQSLAAFTTQFLANGLVTNADASIATNTVDLAEIFAQANQIITQVTTRAQTAGTPIDLSGISTLIETNQNDAINTPPSTTGSQGTISDTAGLTPLAKVKKFVLTLGDVGASVEMASLGGDKKVLGESEEFQTQVEAAELATSAGLENAVEATGMVVEAMARAYEAYDKDNSLVTWASADGIAVTIAPMSETNTETQAVTVTSVVLTVEQSVLIMDSLVSMNMTSTVMDVETTEDVSSEGVETDTGMGNVKLSGTADAGTVTLTVMDTSHFSVGSLMTVMDESASSETESLTVTDVSLMLDVKVMQKVSETVADPVSFRGKLTTTLSMLSANETWTAADGGDSETSTLDVEAIKFSLWGTVSNTSGESMKVSLSVIGDGTGVTFSEMWSDNQTTTSDNETAENYADLSLALTFDANLAGVIGAVKASYSVKRTAELGATSTFSLKWPGRKWTATAVSDDDDSTPQSIKVKNRDGVTAVFTEDDSNWTGTISLKGVQYATVDGVVVTYSDGEFDSLDIFE